MPAIATSGLAFYTGDKFPQWKNNLFVGGMRQGEVPRSGHLERFDFNDKWEELHREGMLRELQQRIRDVRQGPDGYLYRADRRKRRRADAHRTRQVGAYRELGSDPFTVLHTQRRTAMRILLPAALVALIVSR